MFCVALVLCCGVVKLFWTVCRDASCQCKAIQGRRYYWWWRSEHLRKAIYGGEFWGVCFEGCIRLSFGFIDIKCGMSLISFHNSLVSVLWKFGDVCYSSSLLCLLKFASIWMFLICWLICSILVHLPSLLMNQRLIGKMRGRWYLAKGFQKLLYHSMGTLYYYYLFLFSHKSMSVF